LLDDRSAKIRAWLDKTLGQNSENDEVDSSYASFSSSTSSPSLQFPAFEQTEKAMEYLEFLMQCNECAEENRRERDAISKRWLDISEKSIPQLLQEAVLKSFDVPLRIVRSDGLSEENLKTLGQIFENDATRRCDEETYSDLEDLICVVASAIFRNEFANSQRLSSLSSDCEYLRENLDRLRSDKRALDEEFEKRQREIIDGNLEREISTSRRNFEHLRKKAGQYKKNADDLKRELFAVRCFDPDLLSKSALLANDRRNEDLRKELEKVKMDLDNFRGLPPSLNLALLKVEESKRHLNELKKQTFERLGK